MIDENIDKAIIFEDDCIFTSDFENKLKNVLDDLPTEFNIIWLGGKTVENYSSNENTQISEYICILNEKHPYGAFTYLLSLEGAKKLYNYAHNIFKGKLGVDYFIFDFFK
jgi:GR25 family glycosyltransferase involved in LPS biosynthesis